MTLVDIEARPALDHLLDMRIAFHPAQIIPTPVGLRMAYAIRDGRFEGAVSGEVLPGAGTRCCWAPIRWPDWTCAPPCAPMTAR